MKITFYLLLSVCFSANSYGGRDIDFLSLIDSSLIKNASVIKNEENILLDITDADRFTYTVHQVYTVLNEKGKDELNFVQYTSKYITLEDADIEVYDVTGQPLQKFRKKDMTTVSYGEGLIEDGFITYFKVTAPAYPITVEYNYRLKYKGTVYYPSFDIMSPGESVLKSTFTARVARGLDLRYKDKNIALKPAITEDGQYKQYQWSVVGLKALKYEEGAAKDESGYPSVQLAPNKFTYYHNEGDLTSWKKFGAWIRDLYNGLDELPAERKDFFINMVKGTSDDEEKAKLIYDYLQKNFRYVSIQLGIGGLKPFPAEFTDQKKYGDCKGLCNYMKAALDAVSVNSYIALINAGYNSEPVDPSFPENGFNHAILCIPEPKDTIWLECTSNKIDFGVLSSFTENRYALLITADGGVLVPTPASKPEENTVTANTYVTLSKDGSGTSLTNIISSGTYKEELKEDFLGEKQDDQKEFLINELGFKQPDQFKITENNDAAKFSTGIQMAIEEIPEFIAGNKMFITPRLYKLWTYKMPEEENRRLDFYFQNPFIKTDTTVYQLPEGYSVDALPASKNFTCAYGSYQDNFWFDNNKHSIYSTAQLELNRLKIPPEQYASVKKFFNNVLMQDTQRIVIKSDEQ